MEHIDWKPRLWAGGTLGMSAVEMGVYITIINQIYLLGGPIPEDYRWLGSLCRLRADACRRVVGRLQELDKIRPICADNGSQLMANHCEEELEACERRMERAKNNGLKGGRKPKKQDDTEPSRLTPGFSPPKPEKTQSVSNKTKQNNNPLTPENSEEGKLESAPTEGVMADLLQALAPASERAPPGRRANGMNPRALGSNPRAVAVRVRAGPLDPIAIPDGPDPIPKFFRAMRDEIGEVAWRAWLAKLCVVDVNGTVKLRAPNPMVRDWVVAQYAERMRSIAGMPVEVLCDEGS